MPAKKGSVLPLVLVLIALVLVAGASFYAGSKYFQFQNTTTVNPGGPNIPVPSVTPTHAPADETANWKTYTNTKFLYSIKYPEPWTITTKGNVDPTTFSTPFIGNNCNYDSGVLCQQFYLLSSDNNGTLDQSFIISPTDKVINKTNFILAGQNAVKFDYFQSGYGSSGRWQNIVVVDYGKNKYEFGYEESQKGVSISANSPNWHNKELFDQILSTFKFLNSLPTSTPIVTTPAKKLTYFLPSGWKTITDLTGTFEAGYDPSINKPSSASDNPVQSIFIMPNDGGSFRYSVSLAPYDGGSRHNFILGNIALTDQDKAPDYHETSYTYNSWSCLVIYGIYFSQWPTTQGMCAVSNTQALRFSGWSNNADMERFISTMRLMK